MTLFWGFKVTDRFKATAIWRVFELYKYLVCLLFKFKPDVRQTNRWVTNNSVDSVAMLTDRQLVSTVLTTVVSLQHSVVRRQWLRLVPG